VHYIITVNPTATITNTSLAQTVCSQSNSVAVAFTSNVVGATVQWTATASPTISGFVASGTGDLPLQTLVNTANIAGTIDYLVTPYFNGCPGTPVHYIITVNPKPATPVLSSNSPVCQNYTLTLTTPTIPGASYLWTGPNGFTSNLQNPIINNVQLAAAGQYSLVITVNGCSSDAGTVNVIILPTPAAPVATNNGPLCAGNTLILTANTIAGATYSWTGPNSFTSSLQNPSIANITTAGGGVYAVTVTVDGCTSAAGTITVVVNAIPAAPVVTTNGPVCEGSAINLSVNNIPGTTYTWTGPNNFFSNLPNPTGPPTSVTIMVNQTPINPVASSNSPACIGYPIVLSVSTFAGAVYQWTGPNGFSSNLQNPIINIASATNAGTYTVSITAPGCSVTTSTSTVVVVKQTPVAPTTSSNSPVCVGDNLNLTASNVAGAIYSWVGPNGFTSALRNPVINNASVAASGAYSVTVTVDGCTSAATTTNVVISVPKVAFAGNNQVVCANNPIITLAGTITNDNTGIWISGGTGTFSPSNTSLSATYTPSVADITAGNITLTLSSVNNGGCGVSSSSIQVTITPTPIVNAGGNKSICDNDLFANLTGTITYASGGKWTTSGTGTFSPSVNAITATYIPSEADKKLGSVSLTLTSVGNNCLSVSDMLTLTIVPSPTITMPDTKYILEGQSAVLNPVVAGSNLQFSWSPATNLSSATILNPVVTGVTSQLYTLTVTGTGGCIVQKQIMVTVLKPIVIPNTFTPNGDGINDRWVIKELENYPGAQLSLFNRYGTILYRAQGNYVPWDGNYNGQPVPFGTYYYLIDLGKYGNRMSGYIVVLR
jgi:gliding motility-associated-like protein